MDEPSLQERYAPQSSCFGLRSGKRQRDAHRQPRGIARRLIAEWQPQPHHAAFTNILNGGVIGTLLDCHANWTAAMHLMHERALDNPPGCVTAEYSIRLRRPTPRDRPVHLRALGRRGRGRPRHGGRALAVRRKRSLPRPAACSSPSGPDHPAYERW
jgi:acyl-coenzyme A thioesterase PaaI-like protein